MFIEPTITWVPSRFSGYIWLNTKIVLKKKKKLLNIFRKTALIMCIMLRCCYCCMMRGNGTWPMKEQSRLERTEIG